MQKYNINTICNQIVIIYFFSKINSQNKLTQYILNSFIHLSLEFTYQNTLFLLFVQLFINYVVLTLRNVEYQFK